MTAASTALSVELKPIPVPSGDQARWYVAQLRSCQEKRTAAELARRSVEHFLPLYESVRQWKDRRVKLLLPLFPGYLFVRIYVADRLRVLELPGVARFVSFSGVPVALPDDEISLLREKLSGGLHPEPCPYVGVGERVRILRGPLEGLEGFFVRHHGKSRIVISIEAIARSIAVEVDASDLAPASPHVGARLDHTSHSFSRATCAPEFRG